MSAGADGPVRSGASPARPNPRDPNTPASGGAKAGHAQRIRRAFEIHGYIGANGSGKSMAAVNDSLPSLDAGRPVLSTVRVFETLPDPADPKRWVRGGLHPLYVPFTDWTQLLTFEHGDVIMDEVTGVASSRDTNAMPRDIENVLMQLRRRDVLLRWTAPNWRRAHISIREVSKAVTECRGMLPDQRAQRAAVRAGSAEIRSWAPNRWFRLRTYDGRDFEEWKGGDEATVKRRKLRPKARDLLHGPGSRAFAAYDTLDQVLRVGDVLDGGRCMHCGGRRVAPTCKCDPETTRVQLSRFDRHAHNGAGSGPRGRHAGTLPETAHAPDWSRA